MTKLVKFSLFLIIFYTFSSCGVTSSNEESNKDKQGENYWLVPEGQIVDGGPGRGGIPSIDNPRFIDAKDVIFMDSTDLVIGIKTGNEIKAYPHRILNWHEIVNDKIGSKKFALTYCPLTGTGICWNRTINDTLTEFGVSGLIYKNNLIPYDRRTDSHWSQMKNQSIEGELIGHKIQTIDVIETKWSTWLKAYPTSKVLSTNTGFAKRYGWYPYGNYKTDHDQFLFPRGFKSDDRLPAKTRVHGVIINQTAKTYPIQEFDQHLQVINDQVNGKSIVVFGSSQLNIAESFGRTLEDGTELVFEPVHQALPVVMKDQEGNRWNIYGEAVEGPRKGTKLPTLKSYNGFWFAFVDFFRGVQLHNFD